MYNAKKIFITFATSKENKGSAQAGEVPEAT
jgi:hypothetical protein